MKMVLGIKQYHAKQLFYLFDCGKGVVFAKFSLLFHSCQTAYVEDSSNW